MTRLKRIVVGLFFAAVTIAPSSALAQEAWNPFDGVLKLVQWFEKLNDEFDKIVTTEKKAQLLRSIDSLRRNLYTLEADSRTLKDEIPDKRPDQAQEHQLKSNINGLRRSINNLATAVLNVSTDLQLEAEGYEVIDKLEYGLHTRAMALSKLEQAMESEGEAWGAQDLRTQLEHGIKAIRDAEVAVTTFRNKLSTSRSRQGQSPGT